MSAFLGRWKLPLYIVLIAGVMIGVVTFGARAGLGLFLTPISTEFGWGREIFAMSVAIQNLIWGAAQPFAGYYADRYGAGRTLAIGILIYAAGLVLMAHSSTPETMHLTAGVMIGIGTAAGSFLIIMATLQRITPPKHRSLVTGIATAAGSIGQFTMVPLGQAFLAAYGWKEAAILLGLCILAVIPLTSCVTGKGAPAAGMRDQSVREAFREAFGYRSYNLLVAGFFVCGFHVAFILVHLPSYLSDQGLPQGVAANALALVGLFNVFGSLAAGWIGGRFSKKYSLSLIYSVRALAIAAFVVVPISPLSVYIFASVLGLLWLSTVPLTSGLVGQFFGLRYIAMLFGVVFFSHQVGSFFGVWLGGLLFDVYKSYAVVWWLAVALGLFAALIHLPIREAAVARPAAAPA
jgi:MFS family permease